MLVGKRLVKTLTAVASNAQAPHSSHAAKRASSSSLRSLLTSNVKPIFAVHWYSTETAATEGENAAAASPAAKKKSSKTAEGGADKDIRPFNKKLRDFVNGNEFNSAKDLFEQMKKEGPKPNLVSYNVMLTCGREQKDYDYVKAVQEEMDQRFPQKKKSTRAKTAGSVSGPRSYTPKYRSGAWAILVGLLKGGTDAGIPKDDLIGAAQPYCDVSFTIPVRDAGEPFSRAVWMCARSNDLIF
jgi:pentatricopeptide repeat protein